MTNTDIKYLGLFNIISSFYKNNQIFIDTVLHLKNTFLTIDNNYQQLTQDFAAVDANNTGIAKDKQHKRNLLIDSVWTHIAALKAYHTFNPGTNAPEDVNRTITKVKYLTDLELIGVAKRVSSHAQSLIALLAPYGVTAVELTAFDAALHGFDTITDEPYQTTQNSSKRRVAAKKLMNETRLLVRNQLETAMAVYAFTNPSFFESFVSINKLTGGGIRTMALRVRVFDANEKPVVGVIVTATAAAKNKKIKSRITKTKGEIRWQNLPDGNITIKALHPDGRELTATALIEPSKRAEVQFVFE